MIDPGNRAVNREDWQKEIPGRHCVPGLGSNQCKLEQKDRGLWDRGLQRPDGTVELGIEHLEKTLLCVWNIRKKIALGT